MGNVGRYRLVRKLGSGGMAEVYLALLEGVAGFQKPAVVKRILPGLAEQSEYRDMFLAEAKLMASLSHANLVSVFDLGEADGGYFMAMEYVDGVDLGQVLERGPLPAPLALYISLQVLRGLRHAHAQRDAHGELLGIVHRDVSPQNILLGRNGDVKLCDFGIARALGGTRRTAPGTLKGKVAYMSPEQARGDAVDCRSDLFSLGLVLYEALGGQSPYAGKHGAHKLLAVRQAEIPPLPGPSRVSDVLARALSPDPAARYPGATEMIEALQGCEVSPAAGPLDVEGLAETLTQALLAERLKALDAPSAIRTPKDERSGEPPSSSPSPSPSSSPSPSASLARAPGPFTRMLSESISPEDEPA